MTEVKARRKRAKRGTRRRGKRKATPLWSLSRARDCVSNAPLVGFVVAIPVFQKRKLNKSMGKRHGVWETQGERTRVGSQFADESSPCKTCLLSPLPHSNSHRRWTCYELQVTGENKRLKEARQVVLSPGFQSRLTSHLVL